PGEKPQRRVPRGLRSDDRRRGRIAREATAQRRVERRAAVALLGLRVEDLAERQACSAAFACSAIAPNACGSLTASSASTLRSSGMSALRSPDISWLYERPFCRAAALMRMIHRRRNVRFFAFLSR